ncbi:MAG: DUF4333 domain-containing protein [Solirubrobacterales bacterium]|nr:DUF4333 domain-containing protein [Solirubrobacterales bacterium]
MNNVKKIVVAAVAVPVLALGAAGCSFSIGGDTIDSADLESELADQLAPQAGVDPADVSVSCPDDQEAKEGSKFSCELTAPNGDKVRVDVTLTNDSGGFDAVVPPQQFK